MNWLNKTGHFLVAHWKYFSYFLLFVVALGYFSYMQATPTFADPDSFYHIKAAQLLSEEGIIKQFPWLQATILKDSYTDQHFLYHVLLLPFIKVLSPVTGAKVANVFLSVALTLAFYWLMRKQQVKFAFFYSLLLLS